MRNTLEYPISKEEVIEAINDAQATLDCGGIGDLRPYIFELMKGHIEKLPDDHFAKSFGT